MFALFHLGQSRIGYIDYTTGFSSSQPRSPHRCFWDHTLHSRLCERSETKCSMENTYCSPYSKCLYAPFPSRFKDSLYFDRAYVWVSVRGYVHMSRPLSGQKRVYSDGVVGSCGSEGQGLCCAILSPGNVRSYLRQSHQHDGCPHVGWTRTKQWTGYSGGARKTTRPQRYTKGNAVAGATVFSRAEHTNWLINAKRSALKTYIQVYKLSRL